MLKNSKPYIISIFISVGTGVFSAFLTRGNMDIYDEIAMPPLSPPSILFPIVWTILYVLMGISAALIYKTPLKSVQKESALKTYAASLVVNFTWNLIFFNFRAYLLAFIWLLLLLWLVIKTIFSYLKINPLAAYLQIPYALWVAFAGYLTVGIWLLNR